MLRSLATFAAAVTLSTTAMASENLFVYGGKTYQLKDLPITLQQVFFDNLAEAREKNMLVIDQAILDIYIDHLAASQDKSVLETRNGLLKVDPVSDSDIKALYEQFKGQIGLPFDQVEDQLRQRMEAIKIQEKLVGLVEEAKKKNDFQLVLPELEAPAFDMDLTMFPSKGAHKPKVTIVEFADYRCSYCKKGTEAANNVIKEYGKDVELVYVDLLVITAGGISQKVMEGAYCARKQTKFWEYNSAAYAMQSELSLNSPMVLAKKLGLNIETFESCMKGSKPAAFVAESKAFAEQYGVNSTPTFFVNGQRVHTHDPATDLKEMVIEALE